MVLDEKSKKYVYRGLGRKKTAVARVILTPGGSGQIIINSKDIRDYVKSELLIQDINRPFVATNTVKAFDVRALVNGGGISGQVGAIRLGIARALLSFSPEFRPLFRPEKLLTRDSRVKERKKYGLRKARKARQFSKR